MLTLDPDTLECFGATAEEGGLKRAALSQMFVPIAGKTSAYRGRRRERQRLCIEQHPAPMNAA